MEVAANIEPCAAVGRELLRRGHDVPEVPPELVGFVELGWVCGGRLRAG